MRDFAKFTEDLYKNRYQFFLEKIVREKIPCAFFYPLIRFEEGKTLIENIRGIGINLEYYIVYNEPVDHDDDIKIVSLKDIEAVFPRPKYVFVLSSTGSEFICSYRDYFAKVGIETIVMTSDTSAANMYYDIFSRHLSDIYDVYEMFEDETSRQTLFGYLLGRVSQNMKFVKIDNAPQYFLAGYLPKSGDVVIDGGTFDGVSATLFADIGCEVYSFEMDSNNVATAKRCSDVTKFTLENLGLGAYSHEVKFVSDASSSHVADSLADENFSTAQIISLDEYVVEKNLPRIDFIKLDVEGSELDVLRGAAQSILKWKPKLAISAYHKPEDLWTLTKFLKSLRPDYEFALRHYGTDIVSGKNVIGDSLKNFYSYCDIYPRAVSCCECIIHAR